MTLQYDWLTKRPRKARAPRMREFVLQKQVVALFDAAGHRNAARIKVDNEGKRSPAAGKIAKEMGMVPGAADLVFFRQGRAFHLELKRPGEKPSERQKAFGTYVGRAGCPWAWADNLADAERIMAGWGLLRMDGHD